MTVAHRVRAARSVVRTLCASALAATICLGLGASVAVAAETPVVPSGTTAPVNTKGTSMPVAGFLTDVKYPNHGGWSGGNKAVMDPSSNFGSVGTTGSMLSDTYIISEPYKDTRTGNTSLAIKYTGSRVDTDGDGGIQPVRYVATETVFYCRETKPDMNTAATVTSYTGNVSWYLSDYWKSNPLVIEHAGCPLAYPNVVAVEAFVHTKVSGGNFPNSTNVSSSLQSNNPSLNNPRYKTSTSCVLTCDYVVGSTMRSVWYPGLDLDYTPFDNALPDFGDGNEFAICVTNPKSAQCDVVDRWKPYNEATSFDRVCSGAPNFSWTSVDWVVPWVGHYSKCLFVPKAGFPIDPVKFEVDRSAVGQVVTSATSVTNALPKAETCGPIVNATIGGSAFAMNTCSWTAWSSAKTYLGIGAYIFAGIAGLNMLIGTFTSRDMRPDGE